MRKDLSGSLVLDASALIEALYLSPMGLGLVEALEKDLVVAYTTEASIAELRYISCRKLGPSESKERVDRLLASGYIHVEDTSFLIEKAARLKCERAISLTDCFCLALAHEYACRALFARREGELVREMRRKPLNVEIAFLEDCKQI